MNSVYSSGAGEYKQVPTVEQSKHQAGFFPSLFRLGKSSTSQRAAPPPPPQPVINEVRCLEVGQYSVALTIFAAEVDVKLSQKMSAELRRSTKKNPPCALKYELIYVCHSSPYTSHRGC